MSQSSHISFISLFLSPCHAHPSLHMETVYIWQLCISSKSLSKSFILIFFHVATMSSTHSSLKRLSFSFLNLYAPRKSSFHLKPPMLCVFQRVHPIWLPSLSSPNSHAYFPKTPQIFFFKNFLCFPKQPSCTCHARWHEMLPYSATKNFPKIKLEGLS